MKPFEIDETSDTPMWVKLRQRIIFLIESGYYKPGDKLPTVRALAAEVHVNMNTISRVYLSLANDGYIESTRGRGAFVKAPSQASDDTTTEVSGVVDDFIDTCKSMGLSLDDIQEYVSRRISQLKYQSSAQSRNVIAIDPRLDKYHSA